MDPRNLASAETVDRIHHHKLGRQILFSLDSLCTTIERQFSGPNQKLVACDESRPSRMLLQKGDSPNLDLLRTVAVLAVLADHLAATFGIAQKHPWFWAVGRWGVLLFFVHTSLVLMMSMGRLGISGLQLYTTFYIRRIFRIYPLSIAIVALVLAAHIPATSWPDDIPGRDLGTIISNFLLCQNLVGKSDLLGPLWSLPYEIQMYLALPVLFLFVRRTTAPPLAGLWFATVAGGLLQPWLAATNHGRRMGLERFEIAKFVPCFMAGVIAYYLLRKRQKPQLPFWIWVTTLCVVSVVYTRWNDGDGYVGFPEWLCCLAVGFVVVYCVESSHGPLNFLTHHIAKYSYGLYLGQVPVLWLAFIKLNYLPISLQWCLFVLLIVAVPIASYHLIEHPFIKIGAIAAGHKSSARK